MRTIPDAYRTECDRPGTVREIAYGRKSFLLYTPIHPSDRILYLIHGGGGDQRSFFCPAFLNMADHMIADGEMESLYMVAPCFYEPDATDKSPAASGDAVRRFIPELREHVVPLAEEAAGRAFSRERRAIGGFSMGGVTTWYAFLEALDLFYWYLPLSGDAWVCGETGGGRAPKETAKALADAVKRQGSPDFRIRAMTGSKDIAFPNLDAQIRAMEGFPEVFGRRLAYEVLEGGVHDYGTIFRYLFNALPDLFRAR